MNTMDRHENGLVLLDHQDGLSDVFTGFILLSFGLGLYFDTAWIAGVLAAALLPVWFSLREDLAKRYRPDKEIASTDQRRARTVRSWTVLFIAGSVLLGAIFFVVIVFRNHAPVVADWLHRYFYLVMGCLVTLLLVLIGLVLQVRRFEIYALLAFVIFTGGYLLQIFLGAAFSFLGGLILLSGLFLLARFTSSRGGEI